MAALVAGSSAVALNAEAQVAGTVVTAGSSNNVSEVVVTGSHLRQNGMLAPVPVTAVSGVELKQMAPTTLVEGITQLPEFYGSQTPNSGASWFTRAGYGDLNIRGLGVNRTLTLLDGRRVISQNAFGGVDVDMFPSEMIRSVETVTGGASAAYGTDAVAGVANFILDTRFTGLKLTTQGGETSRGDGGNWQVSAAYGMALGEKGHLLVSAEMFKQQGVFTYKGRDWYQAWGTVVGPNNELLIRPNVVSANATFGGLIYSPGTPLNGLAFDPNGSTYQFQTNSTESGAVGTAAARQSITNGGSGDDLNGGSIPTLYPDLDRYSVFAYADYDFTPNFTVFAQYLRGSESTLAYNTPEGSLLGAPTAITIFSGNAFLPASVQQIMTANHIASFLLRSTGSPETYGANDTLRDTSLMNSATAGFKWNIENGGFLNNWTVDGYYQYGHNTRHMYQVGMNVLHMFAAADAVKDSSTGQVVCRTSLSSNPLPGCQPIDLFGVGAASAGAISYVTGETPGQTINTPLYFAGLGAAPGINDSYVSQIAKVNISTMQQHVAELSMNGELFKGWGAGPITAAFGGTFRRESIFQIVRDPTNPEGDQTSFRPIPCNGSAAAVASGLRGLNPPDCANTVGIQYSKVSNIIGAIETKEGFGEIGIPIIADAPFMKLLKLDLAGRWADYSGSGGIWSYKAGASWEVLGGFRLRGTYSRDVRAANLSERFDKTGGAGTITDPLHPAAGIINITTFSGGNPNVKPEKADTFTAGAVLQPRMIPGASFSVDWYRIKINDAIGQLTPQTIVNQCAAGATNLCQLVTRDTVTDLPILVGNVYVNINEAMVRGVDFEADYHRDLRLLGGGGESLTGRFLGSWLIENSQINNGAAKIDRAGQVGIQQSDGTPYALPRFKFTANLTYANGPFSAFVQGRFISSGTLENAAVAGTTIESNDVPPIFYTDLRLSYRLKTFANTEIFGTITNLFDVSPPVTPYYSTFSSYSIQDNPSLYDVLGRRFEVGASLRF
ncbi:MAG TPA: TonB-dependent receptor [Caulobacteraceae bacterium]